MGVIKIYVQSKENTNLDIAKETERLYISDLNYKDALRKAKEEFEKSYQEPRPKGS